MNDDNADAMRCGGCVHYYDWTHATPLGEVTIGSCLAPVPMWARASLDRDPVGYVTRDVDEKQCADECAAWASKPKEDTDERQ